MDTELQFIAADGKPIFAGDVLQHVSEPARGVVEQVALPGKMIRFAAITPVVGDMHIHLSPGLVRVTNIHSEWRHVPREEQTYVERHHSWAIRPDQEQEDEGADGILALLPCGDDEWEHHTLGDALFRIARHLDGLAAARSTELTL